MVWDIVVRLEPLISENQKFLKSAQNISLDQNSTIISKSAWGHCCTARAAEFKKPKNYKNPIMLSPLTKIRP